jgi:protein-S-isoprenylcysteine O-methyltransferase Ste14
MKDMTDINKLKRQVWRRSLASVPVLFLVLLLPAGSLRFWQGWLYGFVFVATSILMTAYFLNRDPGLIERRMSVGPRAEQEPAQKIIMTLTFAGFALLLVLPGLDYRWGWSHVPPWLVVVANAMVALSFGVFFIVMKQNSYAASTIRVEPGQPLISSGVYAIVRHPLYSGALLLTFFTPLALGSYWSLLILIPLLPVLIWRLLDEERFLSRHLPGYVDYCRTTRFRLIPLIW